MSFKVRVYVLLIAFLSFFPVYIFLMVYAGEDNIFLRLARIPSGFLAILGIIILVAFAVCTIVDLFFVLKNMLIKPRLGEILVSEGYITKEELKGALSLQGLRIGEVLANEGRITIDQLNQALDIQKDVRRRLGDILKEMGHVTDEDIEWALAKEKRRVGRILLDMGLLSDYEVGWALSKQRKPMKL